MKTIQLILTSIFLFFGFTMVYGQAVGTSCADPVPICTQQGVTFTANANGQPASTVNPGNDYGCLFT